MISDGTCKLCDDGAHGTPSNVFHNDDFDDAHVDPGTLRHAGHAGLHLSHHPRHCCCVQEVRHTAEDLNKYEVARYCSW